METSPSVGGPVHSARRSPLAAHALALVALAAVSSSSARAEEPGTVDARLAALSPQAAPADPTDAAQKLVDTAPSSAGDTARVEGGVEQDGASPLGDAAIDAEAPTIDATELAALAPPAPLPVDVGIEPVRFGRVDPFELLVSGTVAAAACTAAVGPLGACGALTAVLGVSGIVGVLGVGLPPIFAVLGAISAYCVSVPVFFALGPVSSSTAFVGAVNGLSFVDDDVPVVPMLLAALPSIGLAFIGSTLAFAGTTMLTVSTLAVDPQGTQVSTVLIAAGLLTAALSGPVAVLSTVAVGQLFSSSTGEEPLPLEEGAVPTPAQAADNNRY